MQLSKRQPDAQFPEPKLLAEARPAWTSWRDAHQVVLHPPHLKKTLRIAGIVGTVLFCINQLDVVLSGRANAIVWLKICITYCVPFVVSNLGLLIGAKEPR